MVLPGTVVSQCLYAFGACKGCFCLKRSWNLRLAVTLITHVTNFAESVGQGGTNIWNTADCICLLWDSVVFWNNSSWQPRQGGKWFARLGRSCKTANGYFICEKARYNTHCHVHAQTCPELENKYLQIVFRTGFRYPMAWILYISCFRLKRCDGGGKSCFPLNRRKVWTPAGNRRYKPYYFYFRFCWCWPVIVAYKTQQ